MKNIKYPIYDPIAGAVKGCECVREIKLVSFDNIEEINLMIKGNWIYLRAYPTTGEILLGKV